MRDVPTRNSAIAEITLQNFRKTRKTLEKLETTRDGESDVNLLEITTLQKIRSPHLQPGGCRFDPGHLHDKLEGIRH